MIKNSSELLGTWRQISAADPVSVTFKEDGTLTYVIHQEGSEQIIKLVYETNNGVIKTNQPSRPSVERTVFSVSPDGFLTLNYDGETTVFEKAENCENLPND